MNDAAMTPTTLAEALADALVAADDAGSDRDDWAGSEYVDRMAARLLALPPEERAALAAELLDVEVLGRAILAIWPHHTEGSGSYPPSPSDYSTQVPDPFGGRPDAASILAALRSPQ